MSELVNVSINFALETAKEAVNIVRVREYEKNNCWNEAKICYFKWKSFEKWAEFSKKKLIFTCLKTPTENLTNTLSFIFAIMNIKNMQYDVCHLEDKRQIIVRFNTTSDPDRVWTQRSRLKGSYFFVGQDLSASIKTTGSVIYNSKGS